MSVTALEAIAANSANPSVGSQAVVDTVANILGNASALQNLYDRNRLSSVALTWTPVTVTVAQAGTLLSLGLVIPQSTSPLGGGPMHLTTVTP